MADNSRPGIGWAGHREITSLAGYPGSWATKARLKGFRRAILEAGVDPRSQRVEFDNFRADSGYELARQVLTAAPSEFARDLVPPTGWVQIPPSLGEGPARAVAGYQPPRTGRLDLGDQRLRGCAQALARCAWWYSGLPW